MSDQTTNTNPKSKISVKKIGKILLIALVVLVIGFAIGFGVRYLQNRNQQATQDKFEAVNIEVDKLYTQGKYEDVPQLWQNLLNEINDTETRYVIYLSLGSAYINLNQLDKAKEQYLLAEQEVGEPRIGTVYSLATISEAQGENEEAIAYYEQAIEFRKRDRDIQTDYDINQWTDRIKALKGEE